MNDRPRHEYDDLPRDSVEEQLRALSAVQPPASLREKLIARLAYLPVRESGRFSGEFWFRAFGAALATAAVVAVVSTVAWLGGPPRRPVRPSTEGNARSAGMLATDQNSIRPSDINICDINTLR
jgi:hypothetical protein